MLYGVYCSLLRFVRVVVQKRFDGEKGIIPAIFSDIIDTSAITVKIRINTRDLGIGVDEILWEFTHPTFAALMLALNKKA
jgi:hypothetical protein